jgi:cleavage and polyadenylation specificity factor subunit 1
MNAIRQEVLPASGVTFATGLKLTPSTIENGINVNARYELAARALYNVVVARSNLIRVFEVREAPSSAFGDAVEEREKVDSVRKGTDTVEGEVLMDEGGEGFVNIGGKVNQHLYILFYVVLCQYNFFTDVGVCYQTEGGQARLSSRFHLLREHRVHGTVTGVERVRTLASLDDNLDRLLVSFRDAKVRSTRMPCNLHTNPQW